MKKTFANLFTTIVLLSVTSFVLAAPAVPYTENFTSDVANWRDGANVAANFAATGGPEGSGYANVNASIVNPTALDQNLILFRGQSNFNSSNHLVEGEWIAGGVNRFSTFVRHNAPNPLSYFVRFAPAAGFPGIAAIKPTDVPPNVWTELSFIISANNGNIELFPEGMPSDFPNQFTTVFSNLARIQVGVTLPPNFGTAGQFSFGLDKVSSNVPEPATGLLAVLAMAGLAIRRRRG
jgi:hypothetical protein